MSRPHIISLEEFVLASQDSPLGGILPSLERKRAVNLASILSLEELKLVQAVASSGAITSKKLAEELHLSRSTARKQAVKIVEKKVLICTENSSNKNHFPTNVYHLAPGITPEIVEIAIKLKEQAINGVSTGNISILRANSFEVDYPIYNGQESADLLKTRLLSFPQPLRNTLNFLPVEGISASQGAKITNLDSTTIHKRLRQLFKLGWLTRELVSREESRSEYVYYLAQGLTPELIKATFESLETMEIEQQTIDAKHSFDSILKTQDEKSESNMDIEQKSLQLNSPQSAEEIFAKLNKLISLLRQTKELKAEILAIGGQEAKELISNLMIDNS